MSVFIGRSNEGYVRHQVSKNPFRYIVEAAAAVNTDLDWQESGTNSAITIIPGALQVTTGTTAANASRLSGFAGSVLAETGTWVPDVRPAFQTVFRALTLGDNAVWYAGLKITNVDTVATDDDQAYFRFNSAVDANWQCVYSIDGTDYTVDSGVPVTAGEKYLLAVTFDENRVPTFWIGVGKQCVLSAMPVTTGAAVTSAAAILPFMGVVIGAGGATAAPVMYLYALDVSADAYA